MSKETLRKVEKLLLKLRLADINRDQIWKHFFSIQKEVTRALEPTYSQDERKMILIEIQLMQTELNRQKNLLSKISKELRNHST